MDKSLLGYAMLEPGDRVSGGEDSTTLVYLLVAKCHNYTEPFTVTAVYMATEYDLPELEAELASHCADWGIPLDVVRYTLADRLKEGRNLGCYWCATQRHTELWAYAERNGYTEIALGPRPTN